MILNKAAVRLEKAQMLADLLQKHSTALAVAMSRETNRCISDFLNDSLPKAVQTIRYFSYAKLVLESEESSLYGVKRRDPVGRVAVITPWNDPPVAFAWKVIPALLGDNTVLWKPSEFLTESSKLLAELTQKAGFDKFSLFGTSRADGEELIKTELLDMVAFTGSAATAKQILHTLVPRRLVRTHIETGGRGICVVSSNAKNVVEAARHLARCCFYNQGQICSKPFRIFVAKKIQEVFLEAFTEEALLWSPNDDPLKKSTKVGGMITDKRADNFCDALSLFLTKNKNNVILSGGVRRCFGTGVSPNVVLHLKGCEFAPDEEIFAPLAVISSFDDITKPLKYAQASRYALENGIYSQDISEIELFLKYTPSGMCSINTWGTSPVGFPFGGNRESGFGLEKCVETLPWYTSTKYIHAV